MTGVSLEERLQSPGYTPAARDVEALLRLLATADDELAKRIDRALGRTGDRAASLAMERFSESVPPARARLCALVGRVFIARPEERLGAWLVERLGDSDPKTRRRAASALGKTRDPRYEAPLLEALERSDAEPERRALVAALGAAGRERALSVLSGIASEGELARVVREARAKIERTALRAEVGGIRLDAIPTREMDLLLHVRAGLEEVLLEEIGDRAHARQAGRGRVLLRLTGPLADVFRARTFLHVGFPLDPEPLAEGGAASAVVRALTSDKAQAVFASFTRGPVRYRIEWALGGRRRAATFDIAARVRALRPDLVNDPTAALWEAVVSEGPDSVVRVELWPRALSDERFSYRRATLPASSHPTVAAALARMGGVDAADVVWDPFVGAGTELVERALLGPYRALYGSDVDPRALDVARQNLRAANVARFHLAVGDARTTGPPERPSLIITNPPFGKRMLRPDAIRPLLGAVLENAAARLGPGGRIVWVSPLPDATRVLARDAGLSVDASFHVDVGGVSAAIQRFVLRRPHRFADDGRAGPEGEGRAKRGARGGPRRKL